MFNSIIGDGLTFQTFVICMLASLALGFVVALLHLKTTAKNNSKNIVTTLCLLPTVVAAVILLVNGNLGTGVAVAGAFSLVRFRSQSGNSREILSVFFAMAIGLAVGTGYIAFAVLFTLIVSVVSYVLYLTKFGENKNQNKVLKIVIPENLDYTDEFIDLFSKYLVSYNLDNAKTTNMGSMFELTYNVELKKETNKKKFIDEIRVRNGNLKVSLSHPLVTDEL